MSRYNSAKQSLSKERNFHFTFVSLHSSGWPIGTECLHSVLTSHNYSVSRIFLGENVFFEGKEIPLLTESDTTAIINTLRNLQPDIVGFSLLSAVFLIAKDITQRIQRELNIPAIWGGIHPTLCPEECIQIADIICIGEGEEAILELTQKMSEGKDITNIRNLWIRKADKVIKNPLRPPLEDLDWIPLQDFEQERYYINAESAREHFLSPDYYLMVSRGCLFTCSFCFRSCSSMQYYKKVRMHSIENIITELTKAKEYLKKDYIYFMDDFFPVDLGWIKSFCKEYKRQINLPFFCYFHPLAIKEEQLRLLIEAGLKKINVGIGSASERIRLGVLGRDELNNDILKASRILNKYNGLLVYYDMIIHNPYETTEDKREGLKFLLNISRPAQLHIFSMEFLPETELTKKALSEGIISPTIIEGKRSKRIRPYVIKDVFRHLRYEHCSYCLHKNNFLWTILLGLIDIKYEGYYIYPKWFIRSLIQCRFILKYPKILLSLVRTTEFFSKGLIYYRKFRLNKFLTKVFEKFYKLHKIKIYSEI